MRALINGERRGSLGVVAGLFGVLMLLAASLALTFAYRGQINTLSERIYTRCLERQRYDTANSEAVKASNELYRRILAQVRSTPVPPNMREQQRQYIDSLSDAVEQTDRAIAAGVIGQCEQYRQL